LHPKEEEYRKRKAAENPARLKQSESKPSCVESPSGPLTLRIKLGSRSDSTKDKSVAKIVASDSTSHSSRKRNHGDQGGLPSSSKHAKK